MTNTVPFSKADKIQQIIFGEVYIPDQIDTDGEFMTASEIQKMAHRFIAKGGGYVNHEHNKGIASEDAYIVESFIAREDDTIFKAGAWVIGVHIPNPDIWAQVESGEIAGFSMEGRCAKGDLEEVEVDIPVAVHGITYPVNGHTHTYSVSYAGDVYLGGSTSFDDGHSHLITKGTSTDPTNEHSHRFISMEVTSC